MQYVNESIHAEQILTKDHKLLDTCDGTFETRNTNIEYF